MNGVVYYFTGTGNTFVVARDIADELGALPVPIASLRKQPGLYSDADVVGIVFPVYYADLPCIVRRFAERLHIAAGTYLFAVATYGGAVGRSIHTLRRLLHTRSIDLAAWFGVHMPQNAFRKPWENHAKLYERWHGRCDSITRRVQSQRRGAPISDQLLGGLLSPINGLAASLSRRYLRKLSDSSAQASMCDLIFASDHSFSVTEACTGCGLCSRVCPVDNLVLSEGSPQWRHHCENCMACYNWCPQQAITTEITESGFYYRHPAVTASEIMVQREGL